MTDRQGPDEPDPFAAPGQRPDQDDDQDHEDDRPDRSSEFEDWHDPRDDEPWPWDPDGFEGDVPRHIALLRDQKHIPVLVHLRTPDGSISEAPRCMTCRGPLCENCKARHTYEYWHLCEDCGLG